MSKFRAMLGDRFLDVEADGELAAQEQAFARLVRDLSPADFTVWPTGPKDDWRVFRTDPKNSEPVG